MLNIVASNEYTVLGNRYLVFAIAEIEIWVQNGLPTGFIAGVKVMLSSDVRRTDCKQYEEVNIPVSEPAPVSVGNNLVQISSLDEVKGSFFQMVRIITQRIESHCSWGAGHCNQEHCIYKHLLEVWSGGWC